MDPLNYRSGYAVAQPNNTLNFMQKYTIRKYDMSTRLNSPLTVISIPPSADTKSMLD